MIIDLARRALFIAIRVIVPGENSKPGAVLVIDKVLPTIGPNANIPVPIFCLAGAGTEEGRSSQRLGLDPEIFVTIANAIVRAKP